MPEVVLPPGSGALVKLVVTRALPARFSQVRSLLRGKTILVVGPSGAGKTTFLDYLNYGIFQKAGAHNRTLDPITGRKFELHLGTNDTLRVDVRRTVDVPGQYGTALADEAFDRRPHALIVMLDASAPLLGAGEASSSAEWLAAFCQRLDSKWQHAKRRKNRLKYMAVVANKQDLVDEPTLSERLSAFSTVVDNHIKAARGPNMRTPQVVPCSCVANPDDTGPVDAIVIALAKALADA